MPVFKVNHFVLFILLSLLIIFVTITIFKESMLTIKSEYFNKKPPINCAPNNEKTGLLSNDSLIKTNINLVLTVCGTTLLSETMSVIKSVLIFSSSSYIHFIIFTENTEMKTNLTIMFQNLPDEYKDRTSLVLRTLTYPEKGRGFRNLVRPCASFRLFLPEVLIEYDAAIYLDSDLLFFDSVENLWNHFLVMDENHVMALVEERWEYQKEGLGHPIVGLMGVTCGLLMMNLTRLRSSNFTDTVIDIYNEYTAKKVVLYGDFSLLAIYFSNRKQNLLILSCQWDYDDVYCRDGPDMCPTVVDHGVSVIHHTGFRSLKEENYRDKILDVFTHVFDDYEMGTDIKTNLLNPMIKGLNKINTRCSRNANYLLKNIVNFIYK